MPELRFLISVLGELFRLIVAAFLLRYLLQAVRADFRNPIAQFIVRLTNPLVLPLRRVLPPLGRTDTASLVAVLVVQLAAVIVLSLLDGGGRISAGLLFATAAINLVSALLGLYWVALVVYFVLSWVTPAGSYHPLGRVVGVLCEPILSPLRRIVPPLAGLDLSVLAAFLLIQFLQYELSERLGPLLLRSLVD